MEAFTQPLKKGMLGLNIEQLHDALREIGFVPDKEEVNNQFFGVTTEQFIQDFQATLPNELEANGVLDEKTTHALENAVTAMIAEKPFLIEGVIRSADGEPVPNHKIKLFDTGFSDEKLIGEVTTDALGRYRLRYASNQLLQDKIKPDIRVDVFNDSSEAIGSSEVIFNAKPQSIQDVTLAEGALPFVSEYTKINNEIDALNLGVEIDQLTDDNEILRVANKLSKSPNEIKQVIEIQGLARQTGMQRSKGSDSIDKKY